jgi:hypothetical protein
MTANTQSTTVFHMKSKSKRSEGLPTQTTAEAVEQCIIDGISLAEIIVHPDTELLGQD